MVEVFTGQLFEDFSDQLGGVTKVLRVASLLQKQEKEMLGVWLLGQDIFNKVRVVEFSLLGIRDLQAVLDKSGNYFLLLLEWLSSKEESYGAGLEEGFDSLQPVLSLGKNDE